LEQAEHQRVMLISDTAGMGKSTLLTHLCKQIKQKFPAKWVVRIDLNNHTDALKELQQEQVNKEKAIEFVSKKLQKLKPGLELELFKQCCEQIEKVRTVIMLDGFDEISPFYKKTVIDLLQGLRQTAVEQLWVTTRPHLRDELEDKLQQLSYTLEPFSEEDQIAFLRKFWSLKDWFTQPNDKGEEKEKGKLEIYAEKLIKKLFKSISDKDRALTGIPLQTRMLAEAFDEEVKTFYQSAEPMFLLEFKLELFELYGRFIERKYDIFQEEKCIVRVDNVAAIEQRERDLKNMRKDHQLLALKVLFTEEQVALIESKCDSTFSIEQLTRIGIVQVSHGGKPQFIHRTFAEYYVADCLVNSLTEGNNISEQVLSFILKDIFQKEHYQVIRAFIDGLLSRCKITKVVLKQYGNRIHDLRIYYDKILHRAAFEGNSNIIGFLLDSVQAGDHTDKVNKLLVEEDEEGLTAWHIAVLFNNTQVLEKLWECAEKKLTAEELKNKLLLAAVSVTIKSRSREAWWSRKKTLWSWRETILLMQICIEGGNWPYEAGTVWQVAALLGNLEILQKLWEWAKEKLTTEEINNTLLLGTDNEGRTAWHLAAMWSNVENLQKVWEWAKERLTTEEINTKFLLGTDNGGRTAWHLAAIWGNVENLQKVWDLAKEKQTTEEIGNKLLLGTDNEGRTVWHWAACCRNLEILQNVWEWAKENLTTEEINKKVLLGTDNEGRTAWHMAARWGNLENLQEVWEWAKEKLTIEEINDKLLLGTDNAGKTAWHLTAECGKLEKLQKVWEWSKEKLTTEEINSKLLLVTDNEGRTVWHMAAYCCNLEILQNVWEWAKERLTTEEINKKMLLGTDNEGRTAWHLAAMWGIVENLQKLWEWAEEKLTTDEINNNLLLGTDNEGRTAWHVAAERGNLETLPKLWEWAKEKLTTEEINYKLLLGTDNEGRTAWHLAAKWRRLESLQKIWELAKEKLTAEDINSKLLLGKNNEGRTVWHVAAQQRNLRMLQKVWDWADEILTTEEIKNKLLLGTDNAGKTALHWAICERRLDIMLQIWEWAEAKLTTEEISNKLLLGTDSEGKNAWHLATMWGNSDILQKVWAWAEEKLTTEEINNKLLGRDNEGNTPWHLAAKWGNLDTLQKVLEWAKEKITIAEVNSELLLGTDNAGETALHGATYDGQPDMSPSMGVG